jgi:O-antigen/teichoic acid export membrane protein
VNVPRRVLATTAAQLGGKVALALAAIATLRLTTGYLGVEGYGELAIVFAFVPILAIVSDLGIPLVLGRELARSPERGDELGGTMLAVRLAASAFLLVLFLALVPFLPYEHEVKVALAIGAAGVAVAAVAGFPAAFFQLHLRLDLAALVDLVGALVGVTLVACVVVFDLGFYALVATLPAGALASALLAFALSRRFWRVNVRAGWARSLPLLRDALPLGVVSILGLLHFKVDSLMLSVLRPAEDLGIYTVAYRFLEQALILPGLFLAALFPILTRVVTERSSDGPAVVVRAFNFLLLVAVPLAIAAFAQADPLVRLLAGEAFADAAAPLQILALALVLTFANAPFAMLLVALNRRKALIAASLTGLALNVGLNAWAIPAYGYTGAAVTTVVSELVGFALVLALARRAYPFALGGEYVLRLAPAAGAMTLTFAVFAALGFPGWPALVPAAFAFAAAAYAGRAVTRGDLRIILGR